VHQIPARHADERASTFTEWSQDMSDKTSGEQKDANDTSNTQSDSEKALQEELRREAAEGKGSVGDAARNNNLSGSSTWETLPEDDSSRKDNK
jgi:hypothetical protein